VPEMKTGSAAANTAESSFVLHVIVSSLLGVVILALWPHRTIGRVLLGTAPQ
jgi:hypothetical protein